MDTLDSIHAASNAPYLLARHGAYSLLLRVPHGSGKIEEVALPFTGLIREAFTDPCQPGITINLQSRVAENARKRMAGEREGSLV